MDINTYFDKIFYLNLEEDILRKEKLHKQFDKYNISNFERIEGVRYNKIPENNNLYRNFIKNDEKYIIGQLGCAQSQLKAVKTAYERGYERVLILEDDVVFLKDPAVILEQNLNKIKNWNLLYFGGLVEPHYRNQVVCAHAWAINRTIMLDIINMAESSGMEFDNFLAKIIQHMSYNYNASGKYDVHLLYPFNTIIQDKSFISHIQS